MTVKQLFKRILYVELYKGASEETRERAVRMIEDTKKRRKLHGKMEVFNEIKESSRTALISSADGSLLNLTREKQQALQLIKSLDDRFKSILLLR